MRRGAFFRPLPTRDGKPARGDRPTRTRDARIRRFPIFCLHLFTFRLQGVELQCIACEGFTLRVFTPICAQLFETEGVVREGFTLRPGLHPFSAHFARGRRDGASGAASEARGEGKTGVKPSLANGCA